jgi:hypothetical protein
MSTGTFRSRLRTSSIAIAALIFIAVAVGPVAATSTAHGRVTRGDVTAAFQARTTGGYINILGGRTVAAPARGFLNGRISFFADSIQCSADWHYLGVTLLGAGGHRKATLYLNATSVTYAIDGVPVTPTIRTAIKPFVGTGIKGQFGVSVGAFMAPGSLADGDHSLETTITTPDAGVETLDVTFTLTPDACG